MKRRIEDKASHTESSVAPNSTFKGNLEGADGVLISGNMEGDISSKQLVRIGRGGKMKGTITAPYVIIEGELKGDIESAEHVEIRSEARVVSNIQTAKIAIAEGSFFRGEIRMPRKEDTPISFVEKRKY